MHLSGKNTWFEWVIERIFPLKDREKENLPLTTMSMLVGKWKFEASPNIESFSIYFWLVGEPLEIFFKTGIVFCHCSRMIRMK